MMKKHGSPEQKAKARNSNVGVSLASLPTSPVFAFCGPLTFRDVSAFRLFVTFRRFASFRLFEFLAVDMFDSFFTFRLVVFLDFRCIRQPFAAQKSDSPRGPRSPPSSRTERGRSFTCCVCFFQRKSKGNPFLGSPKKKKRGGNKKRPEFEEASGL